MTRTWRTAVETGEDGPRVVKSAEDDTGRAVLAAEAGRLHRATHPGVVAVLSSEPGRLELAWAGDATLASRVVPLPVAAAVLAAVSATVADLHSVGIVHGRLDPSHVVIDADGRPRLCGFRSVSTSGPEPGPADDVAAVGRLILHLVGPEAEVEPIPEQRWRRRRWAGYQRRALQMLADQASADDAAMRPTATALAASIAECVPDAHFAPLAPPPPSSGSTGSAPDSEPEPSPDADPDPDPEFSSAWDAFVLGRPEEPGGRVPDPDHDPAPGTAPATTTAPRSVLGLPVLTGPFPDVETPRPRPNSRVRGPSNADRGGERRRQAVLRSSAAAVIVAVIVLGGRTIQPSPSDPEPHPRADHGSLDRPAAPELTTPSTTTPTGTTEPPSDHPGTDQPFTDDPSTEQPEPQHNLEPQIDTGPPTVVHQGITYLVGQPDDVATVGDWDCDGHPTVGLVRPSTGEVFIFDAWAAGDGEHTVSAVTTVPGARALRPSGPDDDDPNRCPPVVVELAGGGTHRLSIGAHP